MEAVVKERPSDLKEDLEFLGAPINERKWLNRWTVVGFALVALAGIVIYNFK